MFPGIRVVFVYQVNDNMNDVLRILSRGLDREVRATLFSRVENMMRTIKYNEEISAPDYRIALSKGWTNSKFEVLFSLIAFYQEIIGPLSSFSKVPTSTTLGETIPIKWGNHVHINADLYHQLKEMHNQFEALMFELGVEYWWLHTAHPSDLLFKIAHRDAKESD